MKKRNSNHSHNHNHNNSNNNTDLIIEKALSTRAIKNRQSAQASRERHRRYVASLEASRDALLLQSTDLQLRLAQLEVDKCRMGVEMEQMRRDLILLKGKLGGFGDGMVVGAEEPANAPQTPLTTTTVDRCEDMIDLDNLALMDPSISSTTTSSSIGSPLEGSAAIPATKLDCNVFSLPSTETPVVSGYLLGGDLHRHMPLLQTTSPRMMRMTTRGGVRGRVRRSLRNCPNGISRGNCCNNNNNNNSTAVQSSNPYHSTWTSLLNHGLQSILSSISSRQNGRRKRRL